MDTFKDRSLFLATQQLGEELTNGALLAWIKDMATMGQPHLAQIGGQLMQVEGGHRVVGRVIMCCCISGASLSKSREIPTAKACLNALSRHGGRRFSARPLLLKSAPRPLLDWTPPRPASQPEDRVPSPVWLQTQPARRAPATSHECAAMRRTSLMPTLSCCAAMRYGSGAGFRRLTVSAERIRSK
jgi:hypothetical protein